jgi:hypothetical protein
LLLRVSGLPHLSTFFARTPAPQSGLWDRLPTLRRVFAAQTLGVRRLSIPQEMWQFSALPATGARKVARAAGLGHPLIYAGYRVLFTRADERVQHLQRARQSLKLTSMINKVDRFDLFIVDDISNLRKDLAESTSCSNSSHKGVGTGRFRSPRVSRSPSGIRAPKSSDDHRGY